MSMRQRRALPRAKFAIPEKAPGSGSYPITSKRQAAVAKGFAAMHASPSVKRRVDAAANRVLRHGTGHLGIARRG
jgi:hypothetical protein